MTSVLDIFKFVGIFQGTFVMGVTLGIFYYYVQRYVIHKAVMWHVILVSTSYMLVTLGTVITTMRQVYDPNDLWYWIVFPGYLIGDVSLLVMFRHQLRNHKKYRIIDERLSEKQRLYNEVKNRKHRRGEREKKIEENKNEASAD